jgi:phosphate transport system substrate-binding protein
MALVSPRPRLTVRLAAALLASASPALAAEVRISGTGTALGPMARLARAFEAANPDVTVRLLPSVGSSGAAKAVAAGALEIGLSGRPLRPDEVALGLTGLELARTPFLLAVGPRAGTAGLDAAGLARIYRGQVAAWPSGERIRLVLRPRADADTLYLRSLSPDLAAALDAALARPGMLVAATNQECDALVARTPGAIGPSTLAQLSTDASGLRPLAWGGVDPTLANLASGLYPLWKPIVAILPRRPAPTASRFLAFVRSAEGRRILESAGCLPTPPPAGG